MASRGEWLINEENGLRVPVFVLWSRNLRDDTQTIQPHFVQVSVNLDDQDQPQLRVDIPDLDLLLGVIGPFTADDQVQLDRAQKTFNGSLVLLQQEQQTLALTDYCIDLTLDFSGELGRAVHLAARGHHPEAIQKLDSLLQKSEPAMAFYELGRCHMAMGNFEQALEFHAREINLCKSITGDRSIQFIPVASMPFNSQGVIFKKQQRFEEAIAAFQMALKLRPNYVEALISYLTLIASESSEEQILMLLARAWRCQPNHPAMQSVILGAAQMLRQDVKPFLARLQTVSSTIDLMQPVVT